ncbi:unnamed protein product [Gongylonema pulchrum]|uniref:Phosphofurin acidic cluster sorting protein 2 n=1 Tax=Gongylonema pulchrum TaxID=637853 RepID=A0A183DS03_9BILA|nr:unnamed protein product [Gongylonema pulchrum]
MSGDIVVCRFQDIVMDSSSSSRIVPMCLFANWETDRAITSAVQRMFSMALTRLVFNSFPEHHSTFVITVKLQGSKRSLRSNDFPVQTKNGRVDVDLNVSFTIQYPHFLKRKANILQILVQRRKRYKNRPILGYKTLAIGTINLSEVLQNSCIREVTLFDPDAEKDDVQNISSVGRLLLASCQSQAFEAENEVSVRRIKDKELESEDDDDTSSDVQETNDEQEVPDSARSQKQRYKIRKTRARKMARRKNLKQKFSSLLKKFKIPEEGAPDLESRRGSTAPTAQELEELFQELDNLSDSGPEMVMDNLSIVSNPRPCLRPYFASSSREVLPSITDDKVLDNTEETESDEEVSTDFDNLALASTGLYISSDKIQQKTGESGPNSVAGVSAVPNSATIGSFSLYSPDSNPSAFSKFHAHTRTMSVTDWLSAVLRDEEPWNPSERLWLCDCSELPVPAFFCSVVRVLDCSSFNDCRLLISSIVAKIQKFCNSSSASPPCTILGIIGSEKLVSHVLRAYVESLQNKSADWINFLRFCVIAPTFCALGKALQTAAGGACALSELFTKNIDEFSPAELKTFAEKLKNVADGAGASVVQQSSPPLTPHNTKLADSQDLQIEYWVPSHAAANVCDCKIIFG